MKVLIASDLHGSAEYCRQTIEAFQRENADKLLLLGDVLYHGPRNPLPEGYAPQDVVAKLDGLKDKIICVRGNCDAEIDTVLLPFPVISSLGLICADGLNIYFAHGHIDEPPLHRGDVYVTGHTHVSLNAVENGHYHLNPGSVSLPKDGTRGYIVYENRTFTFKKLDGEEYDKLEIPEEEQADPAEADEKPTAASAEAPALQPAESEKNKTVVKRPQIVRRKFVIRRK